MNKKTKRIIFLLVCVVVIVCLALMFTKGEISPYLDDFLDSLFSTPSNQPERPTINNNNNFESGELADVSSAELSIHFLELGNKYTGDSTLIKVGSTEVLIDAGSRKGSAQTISSYIDNYCTDGTLEYVIATHAHQDHIAGFVGTGSGSDKTGILYKYDIDTLIQFARTDSNSAIYSEYKTAVEYAKGRGTKVYSAFECHYKANGAKATYNLSDTVTLNILYNYYYENKASNENDYSVCVLLSQKTEEGDKHYLFTGDLEKEGEEYLVKKNNLPKVELFKGGHHGSYTATTNTLLNVIQPKAVAVCCCCGTTEYTSNPANTFPAQSFIDRVSVFTDAVYCTTLSIDYDNGVYESMNGNIVFYYSYTTEMIDGEKKKVGSLKLFCSNNTTKLKDTQWFKDNRTLPRHWKTQE